jgi:hypothetical protein
MNPLGKSIYAVDPAGNVEELSAEDAQYAFTPGGYSPATPKQIADFQAARTYQEKYGGWKGKVLAGDFEAMRWLTGGLSDQLAAKINPDFPAEAKAYREVNPEASAIGGALGLGLGLAVPGSVPSLTAKAGAATTGALESALRAGGKVGVEGALTKTLAQAAGSAVEGAAYGAGMVVSENALGDLDLISDSAAATVGISALLGGAVMGGVGGAWNLSKALMPKAAKERLRAWLSQEEAVNSLKTIGGTGAKGKAKIRQWMDMYGDTDDIVKLEHEARDLGLVGGTIRGATSVQKAAAKKVEVGSLMEQLANEADSRLAAEEAVGTQSLVMKAKARISSKLFDDPSPAQHAAAKRFNEYLDNVAASSPERLGVNDLWGLSKQARSEVWRGKAIPDLSLTNYPGAVYAWRKLVEESLEETLGSVKGMPGVTKNWLGLNRQYHVASRIEELAQLGAQEDATAGLGFAARMAATVGGVGGAVGAVAHNEAEHILGSVLGGGMLGAVGAGVASEAARRYGPAVLGAAARAAGQAMDKGAAEALGRAGEVAGAVGKHAVPAGAAVVAEALREAGKEGSLLNLVNETGNRIEQERRVASYDSTLPRVTEQSAEDVLVNPERVAVLAELERTSRALLDAVGLDARRLVRGSDVPASQAVSKTFKADHDASMRDYRKRMEAIQRVLSNPQAMERILTEQTEDWWEHAPSVAQALQMGTVRAVNYLGSKIPHSDPPGPLAEPLPPSREAVASFNRSWEAIENPLLVLKHARAGSLTRDAADAVRLVYPSLWGEFQKAIIASVAEKRGHIPYQRRLMIGQILEADMDGSTNGATLLSNQSTYSMMSQREQGGPATPNRGSPQITLGRRSLNSPNAARERQGMTQ